MKKFAENTKAKIEAERKEWRERTKNYRKALLPLLIKTIAFLTHRFGAIIRRKALRKDKKFSAAVFLSACKGRKKGVNWNATTLTNNTVDTTRADQQPIRFFLGQSYQSFTGIIHFKAGNDTFKMSFSDILFRPEESGWYGAVPDRLVREDEPIENDHEGEETTEITLTNVAADEPPPPPPKTKGKFSSARKKSKP